jgi:hypothetical protein
MKIALKYGAILIGLYLGVAYAAGDAALFKGVSSTVTGETATLQGRAA